MGRGRRPGDQGTREAILDAARAVFLDQGFNKTAITTVARHAEVDAALVYHYFRNKAELFIEAMAGLHAKKNRESADGAPPKCGVDIVADFLRKWESGPERPGQAFVALAEAATSTPAAADSLKRFVIERIWRAGPGSPVPAVDPLDGAAARRVVMVGSQLLGIAFARYVLELEPLASASPEEVAAWFGPSIDGYRGRPGEDIAAN